ncbi:MAG: hypothetical protein LJE64_11105 [Desulfofustis sp.]|nr:hypothetical protein [Desulfofustis sp.]
MSLFYKISIDHVNANYISGWCFNRFRKQAVVVLQCYRKDQLIGESRADKFREDLKALGIHPSGRCGFEFIFEAKGWSDPAQPLSIRAKGSSSDLVSLPLNDDRGAGDAIVWKYLKWAFKRRPAAGKTVVFMHIPKTAGTSFNTLAQAMYPKRSTITHIELRPHSQYAEFSDRYRYVSGHVRAGILKRCFASQRSEFYTIVREPYAQLHSHLKWLIHTAVSRDENYFRTSNQVIYSLGQRLSRVDFSSSISLSRFVETLSDIEAAFLDNVQTRYFLDDQPARVNVHDLDSAVENLKIFRLIGLTEDYEAFVTRFKQFNRLKASPESGRMNISRSSDLFDYQQDDLRAILKPLVWADLELYEVVKTAVPEHAGR